MSTKAKKWLLVLLWAGFIFFLSHQPGLKSGLPNEWDFLLRKLAHISEYAILTLLLIQALKEHQMPKRRIFWLTVIVAVLYALSDEYHQSFILKREGAISDVFIDSIGIFLVTWLKKRKMIK
jgi:VanZ family protein